MNRKVEIKGSSLALQGSTRHITDITTLTISVPVALLVDQTEGKMLKNKNFNF